MNDAFVLIPIYIVLFTLVLVVFVLLRAIRDLLDRLMAVDYTSLSQARRVKSPAVNIGDYFKWGKTPEPERPNTPSQDGMRVD